ncbi:MAG: DUF5723 family protein [Chitinophagales bacterium]|nr:DUF5723 family protein [Chitinophagales bacterium]
MKSQGYFLIVLILLMRLEVKAQSYSGLHQSNFSGSTALQFKPDQFVTSGLPFDINFFGFSTHFYSDYGHVKNESLLGIATGEYKNFIVHDDSSQLRKFEGQRNLLIYPYNGNNNSLQGVLFSFAAYTPSIALRITPNLSTGILTKIETGISMINLPSFFNYYNINFIEDSLKYRVNPFSIQNMAWMSIGGNVAYQFSLNESASLSLGTNLKYYLGLEAGYIQNNATTNFTKIGDSAYYDQVNLEAGSSLDDYQRKYEFAPKGSGFGIDIGATYIKWDDQSDKHFRSYLYKIGGGIRNLGTLNFTENSGLHQYTGLNDVINYRNIERNSQNRFRTTSREFFGDTSSLRAKEISMGLPTLFYLSADYRVFSKVYANLYIQRALPIFQNSVRATHIYTLTPRFEQKFLEVGMPISMIQDQKLTLGAYLRLAYFTLGTESLAGLVLPDDKLNQFSFYFNFRFFPFWRKGGDDAGNRFGSGKDRNNYGCFTM